MCVHMHPVSLLAKGVLKIFTVVKNTHATIVELLDAPFYMRPRYIKVFLATDPEVPGSIPFATRFSEK
jgi:hypothetical protein